VKRPLTPMQRLIPKTVHAGDLRTLAKIYRAGRTVDTLFSCAMFLAVAFKKQGRDKAYRGMIRRARLHAADEYWLLWLVRMTEQGWLNTVPVEHKDWMGDAVELHLIAKNTKSNILAKTNPSQTTRQPTPSLKEGIIGLFAGNRQRHNRLWWLASGILDGWMTHDSSDISLFRMRPPLGSRRTLLQDSSFSKESA